MFLPGEDLPRQTHGPYHTQCILVRISIAGPDTGLREQASYPVASLALEPLRLQSPALSTLGLQNKREKPMREQFGFKKIDLSGWPGVERNEHLRSSRVAGEVVCFSRGLLPVCLE